MLSPLSEPEQSPVSPYALLTYAHGQLLDFVQGNAVAYDDCPGAWNALAALSDAILILEGGVAIAEREACGYPLH